MGRLDGRLEGAVFVGRALGHSTSSRFREAEAGQTARGLRVSEFCCIDSAPKYVDVDGFAWHLSQDVEQDRLSRAQARPRISKSSAR